MKQVNIFTIIPLAIMGLLGALIGTGVKKHKRANTTKEVWEINGIEFKTYYIARAYAKDQELDVKDIKQVVR